MSIPSTVHSKSTERPYGAHSSQGVNRLVRVGDAWVEGQNVADGYLKSDNSRA